MKMSLFLSSFKNTPFPPTDDTKYKAHLVVNLPL